MNNTEDENNERGQVGIGTLIVFIALILVSAVAAGVLVQTAGFIQSDAEATGEDAQDEVSNQIDVVTASGSVDSGASAVDYVNMTVKKSPGSDSLDLTKATVQYTSDTEATTLVHNESDSSVTTTITSGDSIPDGVFITTNITGTNGDVLTDSGDRIKIQLDLSSIESSGLDAGEEATIEIIDQSGASTVKVITVPPTVSGEVVRLD
jgi:flagellin FlaB